MRSATPPRPSGHPPLTHSISQLRRRVSELEHENVRLRRLWDAVVRDAEQGSRPVPRRAAPPALLERARGEGVVLSSAREAVLRRQVRMRGLAPLERASHPHPPRR